MPAREARRRRLGRSGSHVVAKPGVFAPTAAAFIGHKLRTLVETRPGSVALSGGTTPGPVYELLASDSLIDWRKIDIFFADERVVPLDDPRSNYRLARETLIDHVEIPASQVHPMPAEAGDLEAAANDYGAGLPDRIDVLLLGLGPDGHTASLFPGSSALEATDPVVHTRAPVEPFGRLSITPQVIAAARIVIVLAQGEEKADAVRSALYRETGAGACPASLARHGIWILDSSLVSALRQKG